MNQYDNITVSILTKSKSDVTVIHKTAKSIGKFVKYLPIDIDKESYSAFPLIDDGVIPRNFFSDDHSVVAFDWGLRNASNIVRFANSDDVSSVVLPHGDSPFINQIESQEAFEKFLSSQSHFDTHSSSNEIGYHSSEEYSDYDYSIFPNDLTASRMPEGTPDEQIKIFGSPRYNSEWLQTISEHRPESNLPEGGKLKVVFFLRRESYFISVDEVMNTIRLINQFNNITVIIKEHPHGHLLSSEISKNMENIEIVRNEITSASLIEYGDVFLSVGTTVCFEPIMRRKPVLEIEYIHSNLTVLSDFFPSVAIRCKEELYHAIYDFLRNGTDDYYDEDIRRRFINSMISPGEGPVLSKWAEFIESLCGSCRTQ
jgi:hypothetical protein